MEEDPQRLSLGPEEPDKITVIVQSAKNLQGNKKGRCKFSVIFGVGSKKFRTDVVEDVFGSPVWNCEGEIEVDNAALPLIITATEKDDPIGQIIIPLNELPVFKPYTGKKVALGPHKKCPEPSGDLVISAWISETRAPREAKSSPSGAFKSFKKMSKKISHSPLLRRKSKHGDQNVSAGMKGSMSMGDLMGSGQGKRRTNLLSVPSDSLCSVNSTDSDNSGQHMVGDIRDNLKRPEVSGISPKEGPIEGGTRLTIRGLNLGRGKEDIIGLYVCGCSCLDSLEYESTSKIYCTTAKWKAATGDIVVETTSGGKGSSMVHFSYVGPNGKEASPSVTKRMSPMSGRRKSSPALTHKKRSSDTSMLSIGNISIPEEEEEKPEVSGISPKEGPIEGGTRLTIRGQNLGASREDIVSITVCGKDCSQSLEYESQRKLYVTTKAWKPCSGDIIVETKAGGRGSSTVQFTYKVPQAALVMPSPATTRKVMQGTLEIDADTMHRYSAPSPAFSEDEDSDEVDLTILKPEVTGISPREGPAEGGTRLTIRGLNLGKTREDIIGLTICDANCLPMLEYESPMKIYCTTPPWKLGSGSIVIETKQGGKGSSLVNFTFKPMEADIPAKPPRKGSFTTPPPKSEAPVKVIEPAPQAVPVVAGAVVEPSPPPQTTTTGSDDDYYGGATPYPDEPRADNNARGVDPAPTGSAPTGSASSARRSAEQKQSRSTDHGSSRSTDHTSSRSADHAFSRSQPDGQERSRSAREGKRQAPAPPGTTSKPPPHPGNRGSNGNRQLPSTPAVSASSATTQKAQDDEDQMIVNQGNNILEMIAAQDKKEKYMKEQNQERETQSGPTRQELMEEIRRVKLDNRDLREQNHKMKQYLEGLLSHVMTKCPDILCTDTGC